MWVEWERWKGTGQAYRTKNFSRKDRWSNHFENIKRHALVSSANAPYIVLLASLSILLHISVIILGQLRTKTHVSIFRVQRIISLFFSCASSERTKCECRFFIINPFVPNAPFLYPLKTSENLTVFWCFQEVEKGCIGNEWVKF